MGIAYLGPAGTFTETALRRIASPEEALLPCTSVPAALTAVRGGRADSAVVPIENSVEGGVTATLDAISAHEDLRIVAETAVPIRFVLVARRPMALGEIRSIATHSHAWAQVRAWAEQNVPQADYLPGPSTAAGALGLLDASAPVEYDAAICAPAVPQAHPELTVLAEDIGDNRAALTRFVQVAPADAPLPARTGADRTTVSIPLGEDHAGALLEVLEQFSTRGVNLSRIESRPTGDRLGSYFFSVDLDGHLADARVAEALAGVRRLCPRTRFLGSYPVAEMLRGADPQVEAHHADAAFDQARAWVRSLQR